MAESETEKVFSSNPFKGKQTVKRLKNVARNVPILGTAFDVADIASSVATGNLGQAAVDTGLALAGTTPVGRVLSKGAKFIGKKLKKLSKVDESKDSLKAINLKEKDLEDWKTNPNNITSSEFKKKLEGREEELQNIAKTYRDNPTEKTLDLYRQKVTELNPIKKIETMPDKPSFLDVRGALGIKVDSLGGKKTGIVGLNRNIKDGQRIASRLDINGYTNHNKWVATLTIPKNLIRDWISKNPKLSPTSYATAVRLKNVDLKQTEGLQKQSLDIATGAAKRPHAVMEGDYLADDSDEIYKYAKEIFESKDKDWIQVGYNPTRAGFFYDRGTGIPIESADEILQVGPLVLAKNAEGGSIKDYMFNKGGTTMKEQTEMAFMSDGGSFPDLTGDGKVTKKDILRGRGIEGFQEGGLRDEGGTVDPVSGNDVPSGSNKSEVRDDIPAMLSEGEFVFPADVVRYIGLSKLMELRQEAKMGLKVMEEMGQMGNSEEATLPDDFGIPDIEIIEDDDEELDGMDDDDDENDMDNMTESGKMMVMEKRAQGGVIKAAEGMDLGENPYARKGPFVYINDKGETAMVYHDYMNRPMDVPNGYKIRKDQGEDTPAPSPDPTPDDGETVRDTSNRDARRAAKADARELAVADAMQTSAERVGMTLGEYEKLTLSQRIKLVPQEIKVMTGSDVSSEVVEDVINNPDKSTDNPAVSFIKTVIGGILKTVGIDINKTSDNIAGAIKENGNATKPLSRPMLNGKNVSIANDVPDELSDSPQFNNVSSTSTFDTNKPDELIDSPQFNSASTTKPTQNTRPDALDITTPSFVQGMKDADRVAGTPPITLPQGIPSNMYEGQDAYEVGKSLANLSASDINTVMEQSRRQQGQTASPTQFGQTPVGSLPSASQPSPSNQTLDSFTTPPSTNKQTSNMLSAAQANTSPMGTDPTFTSSVIPPKVEPVSTPSFVQGMTDADRVAGTTPERKGQIFDSVPTMFDLSGYKERQAQRQADFDAQVDEINEGLKILEGTTLSSGDKKKTSTRKLKIDAKQGTGAFADKQRKDKDRDKRRKKQDAKKAADKRVKDYKEGKQTFRGQGGRAKGGLMKKDYP